MQGTVIVTAGATLQELYDEAKRLGLTQSDVAGFCLPHQMVGSRKLQGVLENFKDLFSRMEEGGFSPAAKAAGIKPTSAITLDLNLS